MAQPIEAIDVDIYWRHVDRRDDAECWLWRGRIDRYGYGEYRRGIDGQRHCWRAHRVAYELLVGPIPGGMTIDHLCRNRACCNPAHLEPVTNAVNLRRGSEARHGEGVWQYCVHEYSTGRSLTSIASQLGVHRATVAYRLTQSGVELRPRGRAAARPSSLLI